MQVNLNVLGHFKLEIDQVAAKFATDSTRALLAYLAIEAGTHERAKLAALLWPEQPEPTARQNLRQTLLFLKQALGNGSAVENLLEITAKTIQFRRELVNVDVDHFRQLWAACSAHKHGALVDCADCVSRLQQAVDLYQGEFLSGLFIKNSPLFEEWMLYLREQYHRQALEALYVLTNRLEAEANYGQMQQYAARQLRLEPWREEAHRQMMYALALGGQGTAALAQYATCQRVLAEELGVPPSAETTELYEQIKADTFDKVKEGRRSSSRSYPPYPLTQRPAHNLPVQLTPFVGREAELAEIRTRLQEPTMRLLTLLGPGGIGKTRLALEVAGQILASPVKLETASRAGYRNGVFMVSLASISHSSAVAPAIANAIGLTLAGSDPVQALGYALQHKQMLLILDNVEHLLSTTAFGGTTAEGKTTVELVLALLQQAPALQIMATSRERLNLRGEHLYVVPGLAFTPQATVADAVNWAAIRLFVQSARRVQQQFKVTEANLPALLRICTLVEGMPLGLEMAAAWVDQLSPTEIAAELEKSLDLLAFTWYDTPERHQSMRAVFAWSWHLLNETEQRVLRRLSIFRGGFTRDAAETITGASLRVLMSLMHKSLLQRSIAQGDSLVKEGRYTLHELLRQFAHEQLRALPTEWEMMMKLYSEFYLDFTAQREQRLMYNDPQAAAGELQTELDNIRQAWLWTAEHPGDGVHLAQSAYGLWQFYQLIGLSTEGAAVFRLAIAQLQTLVPVPVTAKSAVDSRVHLMIKLQAIEACMLSDQSKALAAQVAAQQALALSVAHKASEGELISYLALTLSYFYNGQLAEAAQYAEQVLQHVYQAQHSGPTGAPQTLLHDAEVTAHRFLGAIATFTDNYPAARRRFTQSLQLCQQLGKVRGEIHALVNLANIARCQQNFSVARREYEQALPLASKLNYRWGEGVVQYELADVIRGLGEYSLALAMFERAIDIFNQISDILRVIYTTVSLSRLYSYLGDYDRAQAMLQQALQLPNEVTSPDARQDIWIATAVLHLHTGKAEQALQAALRCWQSAREVHSLRYEGKALIYIGYAQENLSQPKLAQESYQHAVQLYQQLDIVPMLVEARAGLARMALSQGDLVGAQTHVEAILPILAVQPLLGMDEPFLVYLTCHRVLTAIQDARAMLLLQTGYHLLQSYANHITDNNLRRSFLERVPVHHMLQQLYAEKKGEFHLFQTRSA